MPPCNAISRKKLSRTALTAAASFALAATCLTPDAAAASSLGTYLNQDSISVNFMGGAAYTVSSGTGSPGAVPIASANWHDLPGASGNNVGSIKVLKNGVISTSTGVTVTYGNASYDGREGGGTPSNANGRLTYGWLDGWDKDIKVTVNGLSAVFPNGYVIYAFNITPNQQNSATQYHAYQIAGTWYVGGERDGAWGTYEVNGPQNYFKTGVINVQNVPDGEMVNGKNYLQSKVVTGNSFEIFSPQEHTPNYTGPAGAWNSGPNIYNGELAGFQIVSLAAAPFYWAVGASGTWSATANSWNATAATGTPDKSFSGNTSQLGNLAIFDSATPAVVTVEGTQSPFGLWVKQGDVTLSGTGTLSFAPSTLVNAENIAVENGAKLRLSGGVNLSLAAGSKLLLETNSNFYAEKNLSLSGIVTGGGTFNVTNNATATLTGEFSASKIAIANGATLSFADSVTATATALSGGTVNIVNDGTLILERGVDANFSNFKLANSAGDGSAGTLSVRGSKTLTLSGGTIKAAQVEAANGGKLTFSAATGDVGTFAAVSGGTLTLPNALSSASTNLATSGTNSAILSSRSQSVKNVIIGAGGKLEFSDANATNRNLTVKNLQIAGNTIATGLQGINDLVKIFDGSTAGGSLDFSNAIATTSIAGTLNVGAGEIKISTTATYLPLSVGSFSITAASSRFYLAGAQSFESTNDFTILTANNPITDTLPTNNYFEAFPDSAPSTAKYINAVVRLSTDYKSVIAAISTAWNDQRNDPQQPSSYTHAHGTFAITGTGSFTVLETLDDRTASDPQFNSNLGWDGETLTKSGTGTLILKAANTYTGGTFINEGALVFAQNGLGNAGTIHLKNSGELRWETGNTQDISTGGRLYLDEDGGRLNTNGQDITLSGSISGTDITSSLTKIGDGTLTLSGNSSYEGATILTKGTLALQGAGAIARSANLSLAADTTFDITGSSGAVIQSISETTPPADNTRILLGSSTLQIGTDSATPNGSGKFSGIISGDGNLAKSGSETFVLAGQNIYTGQTRLYAGTLQISADHNLGAPSAELQLYGGKLLIDAPITLARPVNLAGNDAVLDSGANLLQLTGGIRGNGTLQSIGSGGAKISGDASEFSGKLLIPENAGQLEVSVPLGYSGNFAGNLELRSGAQLLLSSAAPQTFEGSLAAVAGARIEKNAAGTLTITATADASAFAGDWLVTAGEVEFQSLLGSAGVFTGAITTSQNLAKGLVRFAAPATTSEQKFAGTLSGTGVIEKTGESLLTFTPAANVANFTGEIRSLSGQLVLETPLGTQSNGKNTFTGKLLTDVTNDVVGSIHFKLGENQWQTLTGSINSLAGAGFEGIVKDDAVKIDAATQAPLPLSRLSVLEIAPASPAGNSLVTARVDVESGTLLLDSGVTLRAANVKSGAVLAGTGTVGALTLEPGAILAPGSLPRYSPVQSLPVPSDNSPDTLHLEATAGTLDLNGAQLRVAIRQTPSGAPSASLVKVTGNAAYGTTLAPALDVTSYDTTGIAVNGGWENGTHAVLETTGTLTTDVAQLANAQFKYKGVALRPSDRFTASLEQQGKQLLLKTVMTGNLALQWNDRVVTPSQSVVWSNNSGELNWLLDDAQQPSVQSFVGGDAVTFSGTPFSTDPSLGGTGALTKQIKVSNAGGGLITGALTIAGGAYSFATEDVTGDASSAKIAGVGTFGGTGIAQNLLKVAQGASAEFGVGTDFSRVEIDGAAVFNDSFTAAAAIGATAENSGVVLGASATAKFAGAIQTALPIQVGNNALIAFDAGNGTLNTSLLAGVKLAAGASVELLGGGDSAKLRAQIFGGSDAGVSKVGAGEFYLSTDSGLANSYRGETRVLGGTLALGSAGAVAASSGIVLAPASGFTATVRLDFAERSTLAPAISGTGSLLVTGKTVLGRSNSFLGSTTVSGAAAVLELTAPDALAASSSVFVRDGGQLSVAASGAIAAHGVRANVSGENSRLALNAVNAFANDATVEVLDGGSLTFSASQTLGALSLGDGSSLPISTDLGGNNLTLLGLPATGGDTAGVLASPLRNVGVVTIGGGANAPAPTLQLDAADALAGASEVIVKSQATLKAAANQSLAGLNLEPGAVFEAGAFDVSVASGEIAGTFKAGAFAKTGSGELVVKAPLRLSGNAVVEAGVLSLRTGDVFSSGSPLTIAPNGSLKTNEDQSLVALTLNAAAENSGAFVDFEGASLTITGGAQTQSVLARLIQNLAQFTLGGNGDAPELRLSAANVLSSAAQITLLDGVFVAADADQKIAHLDAGQSAAIQLETATLTVSSGEIRSEIRGDGASVLVKDGAGTLRLAPVSNSFAGETIVRSGELEYASDAALGAGRKVLDGQDAILRLTGASYAAAWQLGENGGTLLASGTLDWNGNISGSGSLTFEAFAPVGTPNAKPEAQFTLFAAADHFGATTLRKGAAVHLDVENALAQSAVVSVAADAGTFTASAPQAFKQLEIARGASFAFQAAPNSSASGTAPIAGNLTVNAGTISGTLKGITNLTKGALDGSANGGTLTFTALTAAAPLTVENTLEVKAGTLSIPLSSSGPTVIVDTLIFNPSASLDITGFYDGSSATGDSLRLPIIETRTPIAIGAFPEHYVVAGSTSQNFMTVQIERGLADRHVVIATGLAWYDKNTSALGTFDRAHGSFEVAKEFTLGVVLTDRTENTDAFVGWDGRSLEKTGIGTLTLTAKNTYTGATNVRNGTLVVTGLLGSKLMPFGIEPEGDYAGALNVEAAGNVIFDSPYAQSLSGAIGGGVFKAGVPVTSAAAIATAGGSITQRGQGALRVSGNVSHAGTFTVERGSSAEFLGDVAVGGLFSVAGTSLFSGNEIQLAKLSVASGGKATFEPAASATVSGASALQAAAVLAAPAAAPAPAQVVKIGEALISGTATFKTDVSVETPLTLAGETSRLAMASGKTLELKQGGTLSTGIQGEGWTLLTGTSETAPAALDARSGLSGNLVLAGGSAKITGDVAGTIATSRGTTLETTGAVRGHLDNYGAANVRGILHGGADNHAGASLAVDNVRDRLEVRGTFRNSGSVTFKNENSKLRVENLTNLNPNEPGYYSLTLDAATPALSSHVEVARGGLVSGTHYFNILGIANAEAITPETTFDLIRAEYPGDIPIASDASIRLTQPLNVGLTQFDVAAFGSGRVEAAAPSSVAQGILASVAAQATGWFSQLDSVAKRFGDLRLEPKTEKRREDDSTEHFWLRAHALRATADLQGLAKFSEEQYGAEIGADHAFDFENGQTVHLGGFVGYQGARRRHADGYGAKSNTESPALGAYATYLHPKGLYVDSVFMARYSTTDIAIRDNQGTSTADYNGTSLGLSLEVGWTFNLPANWSLTPAAHLAYTAEYGKSFDTSDFIHAKVSDGHTVRWGLSLSLARTFTLKSGSRLQPYLRGTYDEQDTYGAAVHASKGNERHTWNPDTDGGRLGIAAGVNWQLTASQHLHLEYETAWGSVYDVPWSINAGWRLRF